LGAVGGGLWRGFEFGMGWGGLIAPEVLGVSVK
jgi:hypothetical protein